MVQKFRAFVLIIIGIVAVGLSIKCFSFDELSYESTSRYGGDAYTGIQNAAAMTSKNVKELAEIVQFGFGAILLVMGLGFIGFGLTTPIGSKVEVKNVNVPMERKEGAKCTLPTTEKESNEEIREEPSEERTSVEQSI